VFKQITDKQGRVWNLIKSWSDIGISGGSGRSSALCPICSHNRKPENRNQKCLAINYDYGNAECKNSGCDALFMISDDANNQVNQQSHQEKKSYSQPKIEIKHDIPDNLLSWLYSRKLTDKVIKRNKIGHSIQFFAKSRVNAPCVSFPYHKDGKVVALKYRLPDPKEWTAESGCEPILYGYDDIKSDILIWVEGEMDKLAIEVSGFENCVSVPNGASSAGSLDHCKEKLKTVKTHIIAVDNDGAGKKLLEDLSRRLNPGRCKIVTWPEGCKDANDTLMEYGKEILKRCIEDAERMPVKGIVKPSQLAKKLVALYDDTETHGLSTGWENVDRLYRVRGKQWTVVTGIPNHGKSEWLDALITNMIINHKWKFLIFSPENNPVEEHLEKFVKKFYNKPYGKGFNKSVTKEQANELAIKLDDHLTFFAIDEDTHTMESLIEITEAMVLSEGINGVIYDPWNMIEHNRPNGMSETDYISSALSKVTYMVTRHNIHAWIVAHPTKLFKKNNGTYDPPLPYDISGSAHWNNKCFNAITVHIPNDSELPESAVKIYVNKIKSRKTGRPGEALLYYNRTSGRYEQNPI